MRMPGGTRIAPMTVKRLAGWSRPVQKHGMPGLADLLRCDVAWVHRSANPGFQMTSIQLAVTVLAAIAANVGLVFLVADRLTYGRTGSRVEAPSVSAQTA
jgi:hypothetical protein